MAGRDTYYDELAPGYHALHGKEQERKLTVALGLLEGHKEKDAARVLDVGCGTGIASSRFNPDAYVGVDPSIGMLSEAKKASQNRLFIQGQAEALPFADSSFPLVLSVTALQNFSDWKQGLDEIARVCSGCCVLSFLHRSEDFGDIVDRIEKLFKVGVMVHESKDIIIIADVTQDGRHK